MTAPVLTLPSKVLRSATAGRRPGDGNFRPLTDGELFLNTHDLVLCFLSGSGALVTMPLDPAFFGALAPLFSPALSGTPTVITPAGAKSTDGAFATDGTQSWVPSSFGNWMSAIMTIVVNPTRGTPKDSGGNAASTQRAVLLTQARGDGTQAVSPVGHFVNMDVIGGAYSNANKAGGVPNAVGQLISLRQFPDVQGNSPAYAWGQNIDFHSAPSSGNVQSYGTEIDMNNFNQDAFAGGGSICAHIFLNGIAAYPGTCFLLINGGTTTSFSGTVTTAGAAVTLVSGNPFTAAVTRITINGTTYRVNYVDGSHLTITDVPPANITSATAYSASSAMVHDGILMGGDNQVSDNDLHLGTAAYNSVTISGKHAVCVSTTSDTSSWSLLMRPGQAIGFNVFGGGLLYSSASLGLVYNGQIVLGDTGNLTVPATVTAASGAISGTLTAGAIKTAQYVAPDSSSISFTSNRGTHLSIIDPGQAIANRLNVQAAQSGYGPVIKAVGSDANVPLVLQSQGASPTLINGGAVVAGQLEVRGSLSLASYTVATAPTAASGYTAYFTNALKPSEASGSGTGVVGVFTNGSWRRLPDYAALST